jgi:hypothetical protein
MAERRPLVLVNGKPKEIPSGDVISPATYVPGEGEGMASPLTTKGDIYTRSATGNERLGVGTNGLSLVADSTTGTGLAWKNLFASGVGNVMESQTLTGNSHNISINSNTTVLRLTLTANYDLTGFAGGVDGRMLYITNVSNTGNPRFMNENTNSSAANRMAMPSGTALSLSVGNSIILVYDGTSNRWRVMART